MRKLADCSHMKDDDECLKSLVAEETNRDSFTAVVITGINVTHVNYLRTQVRQWTRQLASVSSSHFTFFVIDRLCLKLGS